MTDLKTPENQSEELSLDQLKDAAGGAEQYCEIELTAEDFQGSIPRRLSIAKPADNLLGSADPGLDDI